MLPHRPLVLYSQRFAVLIFFFFNQLSNAIELFTFHSCTVILLSHSHPKHSEVKDRSLLDKCESRAKFHSWNDLTGNKLLVCPSEHGFGQDVCSNMRQKALPFMKKGFSLPLQLHPLRQHSRLFEHLFFLQCQEITKTLISPPNQILIFIMLSF